MRKFLLLLGEFKLLDGKFLTTKEVIEIMAAENPVVFDSENAYNLELEVITVFNWILRGLLYF